MRPSAWKLSGYCVLAALLVGGTTTWAQDVHLVKDIKPTQGSSSLNYYSYGQPAFVEVNGKTLFVATHHATGGELWVTDGTEGGTQLLKDIYPGYLSSSPAFLTVFNGALYFRASDPVHGAELWRSDGTEAGTALVEDLYPGIGSSSPELVATHGGVMYLLASDPTHGRELWKSDGTAAGTVFLKDINASVSAYGVPANSSVSLIAAVGDTLYFRAYEWQTGYELWKTQGTPESTGPVAKAELATGFDPYYEYLGYPNRPLSTSPTLLAVIGDRLFLSAWSPETGQEPWVYDCGEDTMTSLGDLYPGGYEYQYGDYLRYTPYSSSPQTFGVLGDRLVFRAYGTQYGLWSTDGVTTELLSGDPTVVPYYGTPLGTLGGRILFSGYTPATGNELFSTDGTPSGTGLFLDLYPGTYTRTYSSGTYEYPNQSSPQAFALVGGVLYFTASTPECGQELWRTDGILSGGVPTGTFLVKDLLPGSASSWPRYLATLGSRAIFSAWHPEQGYELYVTDGTEAGTGFLAEIVAGSRYDNYIIYGSYYFPHGPSGGVLYFAADDLVVGRELWRTDGTPAGTGRLKDIEPSAGSHGLTYGYAVQVNNSLLFGADDGEHGLEPWITDGTPDGTHMLKDTNPGWGGASYEWQYPSYYLWPSPDGVRIFRYYDAEHGYELWRTDGTEAGTVLVADIRPGSGSSSPSHLFTWNGYAYFLADDGVHGSELWRTNGQVGNAELVKDIFPGSYTVTNSSGTTYEYVRSTYANLLGYAGGKAILRARDEAGDELWVTDGTGAGTFRLKDCYPGFYDTTSTWYGLPYPYSSSPSAAFTLGGILYFTADDGVHGRELWRTDGTPEGTYFLKDLYPGTYTVTYSDGTRVYPFSSYVSSYLGEAGGKAYFGAQDAEGYEPWVCDGTEGGTYRVADLAPGYYPDYYYYYNQPYPFSSYPSPIAVHGGKVFFTAQSLTYGSELFVADGTTVSLLKDIYPGYYPGYSYYGQPYPYSSSPGFVAALGNRFYFYAQDATHGRELWSTDGTEAGTALLKDVYPGTGSGFIGYYGTPVAHGQIYFTGYHPDTGYELWRTNGTEMGTALVVDLFPGPYTIGYAYFLGVLGDNLLFSMDDGVIGRELWIVEPTPVVDTELFTAGSEVDWAALKTMEFLVTGSFYDTSKTLTIKAYKDGVLLGTTGTATLTTLSGTNPAYATFRWTTGASDAGAHTLTFVVSDGTKSTELTVNVNVRYDTDKDGLPDLWETEGYTKDGVFVDLPAILGVGQTMGTNPNRPDIFVEVDYMEDATHSHRPFNQAIQWIVQSFAARGIALHVLIDDPVPHVDRLSAQAAAYFDWSQFQDIKDGFFTPQHRPAFRYCLFAHSLDGTSQSGLSRNDADPQMIGSSDFIVSLGVTWPEGVGTQEQQAGTFMHELGHNLGLRHGGTEDEPKYKPNYISVMNYLFQAGLIINSLAAGEEYKKFDYSFVALDPLDETAMREEAGLRRVIYRKSGAVESYSSVSALSGYGTRWYRQGVRKETAPGTDVNASIDWDQSQTISTDPLPIDVNRDNQANAVLNGATDWSSLVYTGGLVGGSGMPLPDETPLIVLDEAGEPVPDPITGEPIRTEMTEPQAVEIFGPVPDNPAAPVAVAIVDSGVYVTGTDGTADVLLDGTGSYDPDLDVDPNADPIDWNDALSYWWYEGNTFLGSGMTLAAKFGPGSHVVSLYVEDRSLRSEPSLVTFEVYSARSESVQVEGAAEPRVLMPVDGALVQVVLTITPADYVWSIVGVTSNQEIQGPGSEGLDWELDATDPQHTVWLRRSCAVGSDRVYRVLFEAAPPSGGQAWRGAAEVVVPDPSDEVYVMASPDKLWPADHRMVDVTLLAEPDTYTVEVTEVTCNEVSNGNGDGNTEADWEMTDDPAIVRLRAERSGAGEDRIYTVRWEATSADGERVATGSVTVTVPHDQSESQGSSAPSESGKLGSTSGAGTAAAPAPGAVPPGSALLPTGPSAPSMDGGTGTDTSLDGGASGSSEPGLSEDGVVEKPTSSSGSTSSGTGGATSSGSTGPVPGSTIGGTVGGEAGATEGGSKFAGNDTPDGPEDPLGGSELPK